jgi:acyl carrier protein
MNKTSSYTLESVTAKLQNILSEVYELTDKNILNPTTPFSDVIDMDDLRRLELIVAIESHFPVLDVPENVWDSFNTIRDCSVWIMDNLRPIEELSSAEYDQFLREESSSLEDDVISNEAEDNFSEDDNDEDFDDSESLEE